MKQLVITGSAVGIGRALVEFYTGKGATVYGLDIDQQADHDNLVPYACDIGDADAVKNVFAEIAVKTDSLDLIVNNAGLWNDNRLSGGDFDTQVKAFDAAMGANLMGGYYCTLAALPLLQNADAPNVINMLTEHVYEGHYITGMPATGYDSGKFGLWRLTESWAAELKKHGVRVNGFCFGATDTPMLRGVAPQVADAAMKTEDLVQAVDHVVMQGADGDTGQSYLFGVSGNPREKSLVEIAALAEPVSD